LLIGGAKGHVFLPRKNHDALQRPIPGRDSPHEPPPMSCTRPIRHTILRWSKRSTQLWPTTLLLLPSLPLS